MNKIKVVIKSEIILIMMFSCNKATCELTRIVNSGNCIDSSLINDTIACLQVYNPVWGCDEITYPNSCYATSFGGKTCYVSGKSCDKIIS